MTPPYHPASNGAAERAVQTVKRALLKQVLEDDLQGKRRNIHEKLSCFLLAYRTTPHTSTGKAPAELFLGRLPRTRLSQLKPGATSLPRREKQNKKKELADKRRGPTKLFQVGDRVWVRNVRGERVNWTKGILKKVISPVTYLVRVASQIRYVHADHLRFRSEGSSRSASSESGSSDSESVDEPGECEVPMPLNAGSGLAAQEVRRSSRARRPPNRLVY